MSGRTWGASAPVVRELTLLVERYRGRRVDGETLLAWLEDGWTQDKLLGAGDGPSRWLVTAVRAALAEAAEGRVGLEEARAAVLALLPEYRRRRHLAG